MMLVPFFTCGGIELSAQALLCWAGSDACSGGMEQEVQWGGGLFMV